MAHEWQVHRATLRDLDVLVRHRRAMWVELGTFSRSVLDSADSVYRSWLRLRLREHRMVGFIAVDSNRVPRGSQTIWLHDIEPSPADPKGVSTVLSTIYVERGSRRKGVGSALVRAATKWCRSSGYPYVTTIATQSSQKMLGKMGYRRLWEMGMVFGKPPV